ncbi:TIGR02677 family protein [Nakamurella sp. UYEF19]|uniref:TIGR02677 family protein n=1 Tax=Nakamurella sp. UYEF19 TaxID=1756392 RepID=UPI0033968E0C
MRLFSFTNAEKATAYLWTLRALDRARANYVVLLHAGDVAASLGELREDYLGQADVPSLTGEELTPLLDQLYLWQLLDRSYDGARAASLAEYRNRHYVYQFTQAGYRAYRAVEDVLGARMDDATLSRLVLPELLADLEELAAANIEGDSEMVYRKLNRLDSTLGEMADRAARFYLMLSDLARTNETSAEVFLTHKDALLAHMREFSSELARYAPRLAAGVRAVEATGLEQLIELAAEADDRLFRTPAERLADWRQRWSGLVHWFTAAPEDARRSEADRLQDGTVTAIAGVLSLLRRVTEARRGGVSRESQLRHLAAWFVATADLRGAHALFDVTFGLGRPRHVSLVHPDPELIPTRRTWWDAPPVEVSRTLVETGRTASPGAPGRIDRNDAGRRRLHDAQLARQRERSAAARSLADEGLVGRTLTEAETTLLLSLLDIALAARVPVSGKATATGSSDGVRLTLAPAATSSTIATVRGVLHLDQLSLTVSGSR